MSSGRQRRCSQLRISRKCSSEQRSCHMNMLPVLRYNGFALVRCLCKGKNGSNVTYQTHPWPSFPQQVDGTGMLNGIFWEVGIELAVYRKSDLLVTIESKFLRWVWWCWVNGGFCEVLCWSLYTAVYLPLLSGTSASGQSACSYLKAYLVTHQASRWADIVANHDFLSGLKAANSSLLRFKS